MTDVHTRAQRRRNMSAIRSRDTKPEMIVRRIVHSFGYRYRLHVSDLPGKPDIVLRPKRKIIFVHGCFWHMHNCRNGRAKPKTRATFWENKRLGNKARDKMTLKELRCDGWNVLVIWECHTRPDRREWLSSHILNFLKS